MESSRIFPVFENATDKQLEALELAVEGLTSKQIAQRLDVAPRSVDQRIDNLRAKLDNIPRNDLVRHFRHWKGICGLTTYDPTPITQSNRDNASPSPQPEPQLVFEDSLTFDGRAPWDRERRWVRPEIKPSELGAGYRLLFIVAGAVLILSGVVLTAAFSNALIELLDR